MSDEKPYSGGIAIIGMAGRFPKARNTDEFWRNLCGGLEGISFFPDANGSGSSGMPSNGSTYVPARGLLEGADLFDAAFFDINPREAETMDPQHRVFLECAWAALENAGCDSQRFDGAIGVFAGMSMNTYLTGNLASHPELLALVGEYQTMIGNDKDFLPTRVSYKLGLTGPSLNIQTACSTSLVAVCVACQHLLDFQCDLALAGAVSIRFPQKQGYRHQRGGIASPDGHCRPFDARAAGTVPGEGVGIVALKRYEDAVKNGDFIYSVIKGFATNNDGADKVGFTAPSVDGQAKVIVQAQAMAGFEPDTLSYIEAHGTGTPLGDPIEMEALTRAFREGTNRERFCAVGSVKSNIGHLDAAAGVAGLIKTALALHHKQLPPTLHFESPNSEIEFATSPFYVNATLADWRSGSTLRRAGASSFGIGGTNAHVVLEEAPAPVPSAARRGAQLLVLSAKSAAALGRASSQLAEHLNQNPTLNLADVASTLQLGRRALRHRRMLVCRETAEAGRALSAGDPGRVFDRFAEETEPGVVFMFPGQGVQRVDMARDIYNTEVLFAETVDACCETLKPLLDFDLRKVLYPDRAQREEAALKIKETATAQPALFVIEYALARLWMSWGIVPEALIGHSIGEYVAACLSGVWTLDDALKIVASRGRLMQEQPGGSMLAVRLPEAKAKALLNGSLSLAAVNGAAECVISGPARKIEALRDELSARSVAARPVTTSHAFHSEMMEPALAPFARLLNSVSLRAPRIPLVSNVSGKWITQQEATDPAYWARHMRQTVRFADGVEELLKSSSRLYLEAGPGSTLANLIKLHPATPGGTLVVASLPRENEGHEMDGLLRAVGQLWLGGARIDWSSFHAAESCRRVPLPTYPFEPTRHWIEPAKTVNANQQLPAPIGHGNQPDANEEHQPVAESRLTGADGPETRKDGIIAALRELVAKLSGLDLGAVSNDTTFAEMGFESLFLTQLSLAVEKEFGVRVAFRQLLEDSNCLSGLASFLEAHSRDTGDDGSISGHLRGPGAGDINPKGERGQVRSFPLTPAQREIWFASQINDDASCACNESRRLDLRGPLDVRALGGALQRLVDRHEALRTTFAAAGDFQEVHPHRDLAVTMIDLSQADEAQAACRLDEAGLAEASQPFDLIHGPLIRAQLFELSREHHVLWLSVHHIICDGHSLALLLQEFAQIYRTLSRDGESLLPVPMQFSGYVNRELGGRRKKIEAEKFWLDVFANGAPALELPSDFPRPAFWTAEAARVAWRLGATATSGLKRVCAERECTVFTALLAAWSMLLGRLSGQPEIVVGVPVAHRPLSGEESVVGHCTNFLPVRILICEGNDFHAHLAGVRKAFLDAHEHQGFTLGSLLERLNLPRNAARMPVVSVTINLERAGEKLEIPALEAAVATNPYAYSNFDLSLNVMESDGTLEMDCRYNKSLFARKTIRRWLAQFRRLLETIAADGTLGDALALGARRKSKLDTLMPAEAKNSIAREATATEAEQAIAHVWREVLRIRDVGVHDNFFELGGHSLHMTQVIARIRGRQGVDISVRQFFEAPTVAGLARVVENRLLEEIRGLSEEEAQRLACDQP